MPPLTEALAAELAGIRAAGLYRDWRVVESAMGPRLTVAGRECLNFSSNDYLGLANDPLLIRAATAAVERYGVGAGASRLVCGNLAPYAELETALARFKGQPAALVFGSGYAANVGAITALVGKGDVVILDKLDHASMIDGARQSGATIRVYPHGALKKLAALLNWATRRRDNHDNLPVGATFLSRPGRILVITETVFSMDGDLAPLREIVALKEQFGAWLMIDEAHATGLYGHFRRGLAEPLGVADKIDITVGTLSKALGAAGGFVAGSRELIDFLRNRARSLIYSTALPPAVCAAARAAVEFVMSPAGHERRDKLWRNVSELKHGLARLGIATPSRSAIVPVTIGDEGAAVAVAQQLFEQGIFVPAIRYPTVPKGQARLRVTVTAGHSVEDIARFVEVLGAIRPAGRDRNVAPTTSRAATTSLPAGARVEPGVGATFLSRPGSGGKRPAHSSDLRKGRVSLPDECCFITTCTHEKRPLLGDPRAARIVIEALRWLRDQGRLRLLGFVVLPDHLHVAIALRSRQECRSHKSAARPDNVCGNDIPVATLAELMKALKGFVARQLRQVCELTPPIWQPGYHDHCLRERRDFDSRLRYMHENPVRAGLAKFPHEYAHSTAHPEFQGDIDWAWLEGSRQSEPPGRDKNVAPTPPTPASREASP